MIGRRTPPPASPWEDEGRRLAPVLASVSSAVVLGADAEATALVALGLARAEVAHRRVVIADLEGASPSLRALAGAHDARGVRESFLANLSLNDLARPAADGTRSLFILPFGSERPIPEAVLRSERWGRLATGFADAGALLLLVAGADAAGLDALVPRTDGAIAVGGADVPLEWHVLAQAGDFVPPAPPAPARRRSSRVPRALRATWAAAVVVGVVAAATVLWQRWTTVSRVPPVLAPSATATVGTTALGHPLAPADTVSVSAPVNPADSAIAAEFAVELVATNTVAGANLWVRDHDRQLPGITVSPVLLGTGRMRWNKVLAGAWRDQREAVAMLASARDEGVLGAEAGRVVQVPIALLLEAGVPRGAAPARVAGLVARGVPAYALLQDDGTVRLFAGAFETAAAAVLLSADLRAAGLAPQVAYRTGRTF